MVMLSAKCGNAGLGQLALQTLTVHAGERQRLCSKLLLHSYFQVKLDVIHVGQYVLHVGVRSLCFHTRKSVPPYYLGFQLAS